MRLCGNFYAFTLAIRGVRHLGGKPAKTGGDVDAAAKERPEEAPFAACGHTTTGCGLVAGCRRRSRHAQKKKMTRISIRKLSILKRNRQDDFSKIIHNETLGSDKKKIEQ